jgi:hypothetical protein
MRSLKYEYSVGIDDARVKMHYKKMRGCACGAGIKAPLALAGQHPGSTPPRTA